MAPTCSNDTWSNKKTGAVNMILAFVVNVSWLGWSGCHQTLLRRIFIGLRQRVVKQNLQLYTVNIIIIIIIRCLTIVN